MSESNLEQIKQEIIKEVIPNLKKYEKQGKDKVLIQGIAIGLKINQDENIAGWYLLIYW